MTASMQRLSRGQNNARKSTGPRSDDGRSVSRRNSTRHGILSNKLLLDDEDHEAFEDLLIELSHALNPVGTVELALAERVATTLWL